MIEYITVVEMGPNKSFVHVDSLNGQEFVKMFHDTNVSFCFFNFFGYVLCKV